MRAPTPVHDLGIAPKLGQLGVQLGEGGGVLRVYSANADSIEVQFFDDDLGWATHTASMERGANDVWSVRSPLFTPGRRYGLRATGPDAPRNMFDAQRVVTDPYSRGLVRATDGWRSQVVDERFDWEGVTKPGTPLASTVIYETHVKGLTKLNTAIDKRLRGTYAGLAHEETICYLTDLGVTAVELLPVHAFTSEDHLIQKGLKNYWGYNTLNFFTPHASYATLEAQQAGPSAVLAEFKTMVKRLHEAGLEVILDVVYNHTAEAGRGGPVVSFRGLDNATYYRSDDEGNYVDVTGCGNTMDFGQEAPQRLVLDSLRYWATEVQIDGFRFDLATALGRDDQNRFRADHPLLTAITHDPVLDGVKMIAEPWDVGLGGWQTGNFPPGFIEWNDGFRNGARDFWLSDVGYSRHMGSAPEGVSAITAHLAGSAAEFQHDRGPLASLNFVTAHDGFTLADLTSYNVKHNTGNGEDNRDGSDNNRSYNHGVEGRTRDQDILRDRRKAMRNLLGTLLLSSGVPMITAGDEIGRSQLGNNNPYCRDSELTWLNWDLADWQLDLLKTTRLLLQLRDENPSLRPESYHSTGRHGGATRRHWYNSLGLPMSHHDWHSADARTVQLLSSSASSWSRARHGRRRNRLARGEKNTVLLIVHGLEQHAGAVLPHHDGVLSYELLWNSADEAPTGEPWLYSPGDSVPLLPTSMQLWQAHAGWQTSFHGIQA